ncbi:cytochrome c oxidase subunit I [Fodinicurvata sp. EGI_FJ10296]|uniref:cytochrome c oxidase subunit I n=1 Tax=Fodinicurvata sp. EGI_FJ10296 TaxID=3231908 RepID=UPI003452CD8D
MSGTLQRHRALSAIWGSGSGVTRLASVNHSVVGLRFMVTAMVFFAIGGMLAMLIRAQLATPDSAFVGPEIYNQIFTMHGTIMMFLFAIPLLEGMAIYLLPKMLGARDLAFPRLTAYGYWCYLFGGTILILAMIAGVAPDSGWFMYTPLSSNVYSPGINADVWLLGVTFVEISAMTLAVELVVSILKLRAPGMSLDRMPIFGWYILVTAGMMVVGFPPLILGSILLETERAFDLPFFDPTRGGDPLLWQHLFWLFGHPEVYIIFLPAAGALSTIIPVMAGRVLIGYRAVIVAIVALAFLSFGIWVHHMFTVGIPHLSLGFFSAASALVAVPTAVQIFAWLATLTNGRPRRSMPMLYVFGFFFIFVAGGLTGVMLAMVPFNWQVHDTHFVVAHLHYVLVGGFVFPILAAVYYWLPLISGRRSIPGLAIPAFWLIFIGFNMTFFLMHLTGLLGMPRRIHTYPGYEGWVGLNLLSSVGGFVLTIGFALLAVDVLGRLRFGRRARRDPWHAGTLEWAMPMPPTPYAFASIPHIDGRADDLRPAALALALARGEGYLSRTRHGWQETLGVHATTGLPDQLVVLPRMTFLPLITAVATGLVVLAMLFKVYPLAIAGAFLVVGLFIYSGQNAGLSRDFDPLDVGHGVTLPPHTQVDGSPPWWAMMVTLVADAALFSSLVFGTFYLWVTAPADPPEVGQASMVLAALTVAALAGAALSARSALRAVADGSAIAVRLAAGGLAFAAAIAGLMVLIAGITPSPTEHAFGAVASALLTYAALHAGIGVAFVISNALRLRAGFISPSRRLDLRLTRVWADYTAVVGAVALVLVLSLPGLVGALEVRP